MAEDVSHGSAPTTSSLSETPSTSSNAKNTLKSNPWKKNFSISRDSTRISIFESFQRWREVMEMLKIQKDREFAKFLLDFYDAAKNKQRAEVQTQTENISSSNFGTDTSDIPLLVASTPAQMFRPHEASTPSGAVAAETTETTSRRSRRLFSKSSCSINIAEETLTASEFEDDMDEEDATLIEPLADLSLQSLASLVQSASKSNVPTEASTPGDIITRQTPSKSKKPTALSAWTSSTTSHQHTFEDETLTATEDEESDVDDDIPLMAMLPDLSGDEIMDAQNRTSLENEVFDTVINGHEGESKEVTEKNESGNDRALITTAEDAIKQEKCIVFSDRIIDLLKSVHGTGCSQHDCGKVLEFRKTYLGTCLVVSWKCSSGHIRGSWSSQPTVNGLRAGNLILASSLLLSGNSFSKVGLMFKFTNLQYFSESLFYQYQGLYIAPTVNQHWEDMKAEMWRVRAGKDVILSGDGRNDSPGHCAQYCTYSFTDTSTNEILEMNMVDVREANGKSNNMERIGFERGLDKLLTTDIMVKEVVTDGHLEIAALMKNSDKYKDIKHQNDVWHGGKGVTKKVTASSKVKGNEDLADWLSAIRNHFWYCSKCCDGTAKDLKDKWISILHHVVNEHEWVLSEGRNEGKCDHEPLNEEERKKPWLKKNSPAHKALRKIVLDTRFLNTLKYYTNFRHTGNLEAFHNHILMYAPKRHSYSFVGYKVRNQLAAIDYNSHQGRAVATTADGRQRIRAQYSKRTKRWRPVKILEPKQYSYIPDLIKKVFGTRASSEGSVDHRIVRSADDPRNLARNIAAVPRPSIQSLVEAHKSRFV